MKRRSLLVNIGAAVAVPRVAFAEEDKDRERAEVRKAADQALAAVYKFQPDARKAVQAAAGYAAFSNFGMKILIAGSGTGKGVAVNSKTKAVTYMKMAELQAGLGIGVKKFQLVWVFDNVQALDKFVNSGWEIGAQATASAKTGEKGVAYQGAVSVSPGVWLYQVSGDSLAVELTAKGTKYYKDCGLPDELRRGPRGAGQARGELCRQGPEGRAAGRSAGGKADRVRTDHQPQD